MDEGFCSLELHIRCVKSALRPQGALRTAAAGRARCRSSRFDSERHAAVLPTGGDAKCRDSGEIARRIQTGFVS